MINVSEMDVGTDWAENHLSNTIRETVFKFFPTLLDLRPIHLLYLCGIRKCESSGYVFLFLRRHC